MDSDLSGRMTAAQLRQSLIMYGDGDVLDVVVRPVPVSPSDIDWCGLVDRNEVFMMTRETWDHYRPGEDPTLAGLHVGRWLTTSVVYATVEDLDSPEVDIVLGRRHRHHPEAAAWFYGMASRLRIETGIES